MLVAFYTSSTNGEWTRTTCDMTRNRMLVIDYNLLCYNLGTLVNSGRWSIKTIIMQHEGSGVQLTNYSFVGCVVSCFKRKSVSPRLCYTKNLKRHTHPSVPMLSHVTTQKNPCLTHTNATDKNSHKTQSIIQ